MDELHFDGFCRNGCITDLKRACYDDLLAFNAEDGICDSPGFGPIKNIVADGIFADCCHSAARLLSCGSKVRNITIRNVHGSFYQYAIGLTHYFPERQTRGQFDGIVLENFHVAKALPLPSDWNFCPDWGLIWAEGCGDIGSLKVTGFHRIEETTGTPYLEFESAVRDRIADSGRFFRGKLSAESDRTPAQRWRHQQSPDGSAPSERRCAILKKALHRV